VNNRKSFSFSSEAFAGVRIPHRHQKEAQPEGQHDDIQHEVLLVALVSGPTVARSAKEDCDGSRATTKKDFFNTIEPERKSRSYSITSVEPTRMYCPAFLGSFGWGLQQLISQFVVAGVALCHVF
jgi:hypothetical protein